MNRVARPRPAPPTHPSVTRFRQELEERTLQTGFIVPAWVRKDPALYDRIRRRTFRSQSALDNFLAREALSRYRAPTRYAIRDRSTKWFNEQTNKDTEIGNKLRRTA